MEAFSTLLARWAGNSPVTGEFRSRRPVQSFDVFVDLRPNKQLSKQSRGWSFEMPSRSLWRHCNESRGSVGPLVTNDFTQITSFTQICSVETSKRFRLRKYLSLVKEILCHCCSWKIELYRLYLKVLNPLSWSNADLLQIRHLGTNFSEIRIRIPTFSFMKMYLKMSLANWWPFFQAYMR